MMNNYVIEIEYTDHVTYSNTETHVINSNLTIEELFCKICDTHEKDMPFKTSMFELYKYQNFELYTLEEWAKRRPCVVE